MSETTTHHLDRATHHPPTGHAPDYDSTWLAAYALGLAYSSYGRQQQVDLLLEVADGQPQLLDHAHQRLDTTEVADPNLRQTAQHLLHHARTVHGTNGGQWGPQGAPATRRRPSMREQKQTNRSPR